MGRLTKVTSPALAVAVHHARQDWAGLSSALICVLERGIAFACPASDGDQYLWPPVSLEDSSYQARTAA